MRLRDVAEILNCRCEGDGEVEILHVCGIETAAQGDLTFISNPKYITEARSTRASAVIVAEDFEPLSIPTLRSDNPYLAFAKAIEIFYTPPNYAPGIHPTACIDSTCQIGQRAHIGPYVIIHHDVVIGDDAVILGPATIYPGVRIGHHFFAHSSISIREFCEVGNRVTLQNGVVIGSDGFGFAKQSDGSYYKMVQSGPVIIEDEVEIQANTTIDRATVGETRIGRGVKIDNLVQVGHSSSVGENSLLCSQVGLAGSSHLGKNVILTGQVGVAGHCRIGDNVIVTAQSGTHGDIPGGSIVSGSPAFDNRQWLRATAIFGKLPQLQIKVRELTQRVEELAKRAGSA